MIPVTGMTIVSIYFCFLYLPARTPEVYRRNVIASVLASVLLIVFNFIAYLGLEKTLRIEYVTAKLIQNEFENLQRSNETTKMLAYNILPTEIVKRMCTGIKVSIVDQFSSATIIFIGMSNLYDSSRPSSVFYLLNDIYTLFDELTLSHGLEKIKAVNSTYMVASGVPQYRSDHMLQAILLAADVFARMSQFHSAFMENGGLGLRVGIATGDVVAAIVGKRKYTYDCWSDCVNTASRMESHGVVGQIQVTEEVYNSMKHVFPFQKRGEIYVKGKGLMTTYLLDPSTIVQSKPNTPHTIEFRKPEIEPELSKLGIEPELSRSEIQLDDMLRREMEGTEMESAEP
jgi:class 3 adenylate cyclase